MFESWTGYTNAVEFLGKNWRASTLRGTLMGGTRDRMRCVQLVPRVGGALTAGVCLAPRFLQPLLAVQGRVRDVAASARSAHRDSKDQAGPRRGAPPCGGGGSRILVAQFSRLKASAPRGRALACICLHRSIALRPAALTVARPAVADRAWTSTARSSTFGATAFRSSTTCTYAPFIRTRSSPGKSRTSWASPAFASPKLLQSS